MSRWESREGRERKWAKETGKEGERDRNAYRDIDKVKESGVERAKKRERERKKKRDR